MKNLELMEDKLINKVVASVYENGKDIIAIELTNGEIIEISGNESKLEILINGD